MINSGLFSKLTFILLLTFLTGISSNSLFAKVEKSKKDSLKNIIDNTNNKKKKFYAYKKLSHLCKGSDIEKREEYTQEGLKLAKELNSPVLLFKAYNILASVEYQKSNYNKAINYHHKSLSYKEHIKNVSDISKSYNNIALVYQAKNNIDSALYFYKESLKLKENADQNLLMGRTLSNIGILHWKRADYDKALETFFEALAIKREHGASPTSISKTLTNIGSIYTMTEKYELALDYYSQSLNLKEKAGDSKGISTVSNNISAIYRHKGKLDSALNYLNKSLKIKMDLKDKRGHAGVLNNMATIFRDKGDLTKAFEYNQRALEIRQEINDQNGIAASLTNMGAISIDRGNLSQAEEYLTKALGIAKPKSFDRTLEDVYLNLTSLFSQKNNYKKALTYHKDYHNLRERLLDEEANKRIETLEQKYKDKQQKEIIKRQNAENKLIQTKLSNNRKYTAIMAIIIVLAIMVLLLLIYQNNIKKRYNKKLEALNNDLDRRVRVRTQELQTENNLRQQTENDLLENQEKYRTVTETVNAGIAIADVNEKIIYVNNAFTEMLGYKKEELLDQTLDMIVNEKTFERFKKESQKRKSGKSNTYHVKLHRKDGEELETILTASPLFNNKEEYVGGVAAITDISDLKKAESSMTQALRKSEKINNIKNYYLKNISEELRIPLNNIAGMSEILKTQSENTLNEEQIKLIENIYSSAEDIKFELLNMANLVQINKSDIITNLQDINLNEEIKQITDKFTGGNVNINADIQKSINVYGNQQIIEKIIGSLLENAIYHSNDSTVTLKAERDEVMDVAKIKISNTGEPINKEKLEKILDPFDNTRFENPHQEVKDYDYSLVWIRKMLQVLSGRLDISTSESGMHIVISLPLNKACQSKEAHKDDLFRILQEKNKPLLLFSNDAGLAELNDVIQGKEHNIMYYTEPSIFINQLNEGESIPENSIVLIDENLEEPWTIEKTLLKLKEQKTNNILYIALLHGKCESNTHLLDIGFNKCISSDNFTEELTNYLKNRKS
ncbi:MAG: tetratricopeptide repeat protein [Bacteroidales bacterium]|nr:tetratricopeptide repeat protein [Bacteroidales bacterium]